MTIKQIQAAIKSRLEYKKELTELQKKRLEICAACPFNSDNVLKKSWKDNLWIILNKILNFVCGVSVESEAICTDCSCQLIHKASQKDPELLCQKGKWLKIKDYRYED